MKVGDKFTAIISHKYVEGKIQIENNTVYLCQDKCDGDNCKNKLGYRYSWNICHVHRLDFNDPEVVRKRMLFVNVVEFNLIPDRKSRIEKLNL